MIGMNVKVEGKNIEGVIVDETKNSFLVDSKPGFRRVIKSGNVFGFELEEGLVKVHGDAVILRPWDRLKKTTKVKSRWQKILE